MSWYHPGMYDPARDVGCFWDDEAPPLPHGIDLGPVGDDTCDVAIIGGGYTGLSCALHLARDFNIDVRLLEAGPLGWGASGRNGGFCTWPPSGLGPDELIARYGEAETKRFIASQVEAVDLVRTLARDENIDLQPQGDGTLHVAHHPAMFAALESERDLLNGMFGIPARLMSRAEVAETEYDSTEQFGALINPVGFGLQPLRFARGLAAAAARAGAKLHGSSPVLHREKVDGWHLLATPSGTLRARRIVIATNGFTRDDVHPGLARRLMPVMSNIVVTRPLTEAELAAQNWRTERPCANTRRLLFYYRMLPGNRFLFGARGDLTGRPEDGAKMRRFMERRLGEVFPGWRHVETTHNWRGFVCMTRRLTPSIGRMDDDGSIWFALAYHGDGVSAAPWSGRLLAQLIGGKADLSDIPAPMRGAPPPIPVPALRRWYLRGALGYYRLQDK
ncbi:MAG: FAD-binding oxidoreductase [Parvibaculum sp.]|nr:FAD-binding oxidoreductase [Parvibaculum sp.]